MESNLKKDLNTHLWRIVILYTILGLAWIFLSDALVYSIFTPEQILTIQSYKGAFFILVTAILLMFIIHHKNNDINDLFEKVQLNMKNFQYTFEQSAVGIAHVTLDGEWIRINKKLCDILGYSYEELREINVRSLTHPDDLKITEQKEQEINNGEIQSYTLEKQYIKKSGEPLFIRLTKSAIKDEAGEIKFFSSIIEDITKQKKAESKLIKSFNQQKKLLSEVHHRVKNNLAIISGLLELQSFHAQDDATKTIMKESMMRIKSMALIHEAYYKTETLTEVYLDEYLDDFIHHIRNSYANTYPNVSIGYTTEPLSMNINQAIPCGLLLNELLLNLYPHAYDRSEHGQIDITLSKQKESVHLQICNDGNPLQNSINFENPSALWIKIVNTLVKQLNGSLKVTEKNKSSTIEITFQKEEKKGSSSSLVNNSTT